jgi:acetylornithine deacetylase/succinyl-diaminopimelate desuccinylase-like protein
MKELKSYPEVLGAARGYLERSDELNDLCVQVQQIPAPTGDEALRAAWVERAFAELGLLDVEQDGLFNVYGRVPGRRSPLTGHKSLMVSAHTDTVFPADTDLTVHVDPDAGRIYGPGIGDNSAGVASLLALAGDLMRLPEPPIDIWLVANSGEEGLGDLRGMRAAVDRLQAQLGACIVLEGMGLGRIVHRALGSRRYRISVQAPGGHSWSDFGTASAIHTLARLAADLTALKVPRRPRTTFNIGRIEGGTSVNTIAQHAALELDLRSEDPRMLTQLDEQVLAIVQRYSTAGWQQQGVVVEVEKIGDRPGGQIEQGHALVRAALAALAGAGLTGPPDLRISSTDANIPLSRNIPAICVGVTDGGNAHRTQEWISPQQMPQGMQHLMLLTWWVSLWLAGEVA